MSFPYNLSQAYLEYADDYCIKCSLVFSNDSLIYTAKTTTIFVSALLQKYIIGLPS